MTTASEEILARYKGRETAVDTFGRVITVRRLRPSEQLKVSELVTSADDRVQASYRVACAVCGIDGLAVTFPRSRGELDSIVDGLDQEGIDAAVEALSKLLLDVGAPKNEEELVAASKKSPETPPPSSDSGS